LASRFGIALAPASAPRSQRSGLIDDLLA
jgi:hypothetical protein